jgi:hypothetical protein
MILNARVLDMLMNGNLIGDMPGIISRPGIFLGGASIPKKEPFSMITAIENLGENMLFRCRACKTIIDHAFAVSRGNRLTVKPDGTGPVNRNFMNIHLKCPRCNEERTYKLWLFKD